MPVSVVTPASTHPVTRTEAKAHLRVDGTTEDDLIDGLIAAASDYVRQWTNRSLATTALQLDLDGFADEMLLPWGPVTAVSSVTYYDAAGAQQTLSAAVYQTDFASDPARVLRVAGQSWPAVDVRANAVSINYTTGYSTCPASIKHACLLLIGDWYRGRENTSLGSTQPAEMPHAVAALLANYRAFV